VISVDLYGKVVQHHADDDKKKYTATISGMTVDLIGVKLKLESSDESLLKMYPRGTQFELTIRQPKEKQAQLETS
jgi:hypothetical protein